MAAKISPGYIVCNLQIDGIIHHLYCLIKIPNKGRFFSKKTAKPRIIQFRIHNLTVLIIVLFPSVYGPCFWLQGTAVIFVYHQNGENLAKSWSSVRRALESAHKFYSICFYIDVSTFELSLIRF